MFDPYTDREDNNAPSSDGTYSFTYRRTEENGSSSDPYRTAPEQERSSTSWTGGEQRYSSDSFGSGESYRTSYEPGRTYQNYSSYSTPEPAARTRKKKSGAVKFIALLLCMVIIGGAAGAGSYYALKSRDTATAPETTEKPEEPAPTATAGVGENVPADREAGSSDSADTQVKVAVSGKPITTYKGNGQEMTPTEIYNNYVNACVGITTEVTTTNLFGQITEVPVSGSGFIISPDGYLITNCHVVDSGTKFEISLYDGNTYDAQLVGKDSSGDVALLKIDADREFDYVVIGDMEECSVGETVCVIGNPLGELTFSLTTGSISALDRSINVDGSYQNMFQIDAAINSGNSGGPVFNSKGEVIGVATAKYSSTGVEGLAFALPINDVIEQVNQISLYGYVKGRAYMGIRYRDIDASYSYYYSVPRGVYVGALDAGGCAENAGVQVADIITGINGVQVVSGAQLKAEIAKYKAGDTAVLTVYRNSQTIEISVVFDERVPDYVVSQAPGTTVLP